MDWLSGRAILSPTLPTASLDRTADGILRQVFQAKKAIAAVGAEVAGGFETIVMMESS